MLARIHFVFLLIATILAITAVAEAPTFCKCTCFKNSTIIALGPQHQDPSTSKPPPPPQESTSPSRSFSIRSLLEPRAASAPCSQCTKAFCLNHHISFCRDAKEENVQTLCFQRDSYKDRIIVWGFILGTTGLLGWAMLKRIIS